MLTSLTAYFEKNKDQRETLYELIQGLSGISLRVIDWFVTHYAKLYNISYWLNGTRKFNLYIEYRGQLKAYTKLFFDPFRRHDRITFVLEPGVKSVETTVGQLNFFRWALQNGVIDYIKNNLLDIENAMSAFHRKGGGAGTPIPTSCGAPKIESNISRGHCHIQF